MPLPGLMPLCFIKVASNNRFCIDTLICWKKKNVQKLGISDFQAVVETRTKREKIQENAADSRLTQTGTFATIVQSPDFNNIKKKYFRFIPEFILSSIQSCFNYLFREQCAVLCLRSFGAQPYKNNVLFCPFIYFTM